MARTTNTLTNPQVKQAKAKAKECNLALWVKPNGSKCWMLNYPDHIPSAVPISALDFAWFRHIYCSYDELGIFSH